MRRWLFNLATAVSLVLCVATVVFLLVVLPWRSPRNQSAAIQPVWPTGTQDERTYDLCTYSGALYIGVTLFGPGLDGDDPITARRPPAAPRHAHIWFDCSDLCWPYGAGYAEAFQDAGTTVWGVGLVHLQQPANARILSVRAVTVRVWQLVAVAGAAVATMLLRWLRSRQRARPGLCPTCGYDLRATPDRCPECGAVPPAPPLPGTRWLDSTL